MEDDGRTDLPPPTIVVELPDGRVLAADDVGDPAGAPVLYLHGSPDCRLARHPDDGVAASAGIRLLAVDRPGYGASDPLPPGAPAGVRAWADDVVVLLDRLGVGRCAIAAWSAGAPWAFGLAAALPDRITAVVTYGALAPYEALAGPTADPEAAAASASRADVAADVAAGMTVDELAEGFAAMLLPAPPIDLGFARDVVLEGYSPAARAEVESVPGLVDQLARSLAAAVDRPGQGVAGLAADLAVQFTAGLADGVLADVRCPVTLVHGEHDPIAGPAVGTWLAAHLPNAAGATVEVWPRGHQGLLVDWVRWLGLARP